MAAKLYDALRAGAGAVSLDRQCVTASSVRMRRNRSVSWSPCARRGQLESALVMIAQTDLTVCKPGRSRPGWGLMTEAPLMTV